MSGTISMPVFATLNVDAPVDSFVFYSSVVLDLRAAFFVDGELADMTGATTCVFSLKWGSNPAGIPLLYRRVTVNTALTLSDWTAHLAQHARVQFSSAEMGVDLGGLREARLLASWQVLDSAGSVLAVVVQSVLARVSGVEVAIPMSGFYTKDEADARFIRGLTTQYVLTHFTSLSSLDATDPTVKAVADLLCTFITDLQGQSPAVEGEWDVTNFLERLNLNGGDYSAQEVKDLLCTLITDLKAKGVIS